MVSFWARTRRGRKGRRECVFFLGIVGILISYGLPRPMIGVIGLQGPVIPQFWRCLRSNYTALLDFIRKNYYFNTPLKFCSHYVYILQQFIYIHLVTLDKIMKLSHY